MLGQLLAAGRAHGHEPARLAQLERREELGIIRPAGGLRRGRGVIGRHRSPPCCPVAAPTYQAEPPSTRMGSFREAIVPEHPASGRAGSPLRDQLHPATPASAPAHPSPVNPHPSPTASPPHDIACSPNRVALHADPSAFP